jgi:hypothetical protein
MGRRLVALAALLGGWAVGAALYRRASTGRRDRVDLYFEDGSMQSLGDGTAEAERLLPLAREALRAARAG